jgi:hypothetical protein
MTKRAINDVQSFLTYVETDGDRTYQIVNVVFCFDAIHLRRSSRFFKNCRKITERHCPKLIQEDKTNSQINELVAKRFQGEDGHQYNSKLWKR